MKRIIFIFFIAIGMLSLFSLSNLDKQSMSIEFNEFIDSRDNHSFQTVKIGNQTWFAENFAYLPYICPPDSANYGVWVYNYNGQSISDAKNTLEYREFGALYNWQSAKELAPDGWHLPTDEEWKELEKYLGIDEDDIKQKTWRGTNNEANLLKVSGYTGFNIVFGGWMTDYGKFNFKNQHANFWCDTEFDNERAYERLIGLTNGKIGWDKGNKGCGFSVRYVNDVEN
ncbi:fibrobacter succinogenes major paralogous domain-containing protein [Marinigracilibium pacificum]|uniref:Fibrobacter succinogenes major paralogous domain-containing protein n=1 Tax=Marinigracilibium pacificum TaxID=2729599 RepID=A0A848J8H5_9BACT|nr:fibrobacter succinogenes major paralogous domain-containing protein [Marinigracilibium pacificum]NMM50679.1 hypothetical protein [Marinigracilibium pacificum]